MQAQQTARRDQAGEVPTRPSEVTSTADIFISRLLDVISLAMAHVSQRTLAATPTTDTASCAVFALSNAAGAVVVGHRHSASSCTIPSPVCSAGSHSAAITAVHHDCSAAIRAARAKLCPG